LAAAFARSLLSRSKPSPQRTWLQRLKRDSWTTHLSGAISSDSLGESFTDWWTSSLAATRANPSAQPANASEPKTHDTSGLTYQPELLQCDQQSAFLRMSKDTFLSGCATCCKTWSDWVTERRGAWRQRVNAVRLTRGSESGSWPTATVTDSSAMSPEPRPSRIATGRKTEYLARMVNWSTANAREWKDSITGTHPPSRPNMSEQTLGQAVSVVHGQAAPASSSSLGSRQGLWATPRSGKTTDENPETWALRQAKGDVATMPLTAQVKQWATPQAHDAQGPKTPEQIEAMRAKGHGVKNLNEQAQWGTPTARDHKSGRGNEEREYKELTPMVERQQSGKLNPRWVETLMGLPIGWTMPSCIRPVTIAQTSCDSSGMALCRPAQSEPSDFLLASCGKEPTK
jgi:hypothetical protein